MDAYSGYNQVRMLETDEDKTAFVTDRGMYCYRMMPFGLKNAGATYQRLVNRIFAPQLGRNMEVYVDDMLTKSLEADDHRADLEETFTTLRQYNMRLNPEKCVFGVTSGKFLGFMVHQRGIEANPDKIKAIQELRSPRTIKEIQGLTGRVIALSRFVSRLTDRCLPFFRALKKNTSNIWTSECEKAFQELKCYLTSPPMLSKPQTGETLFLYLAVSPEAVSSVLIRNDEGTQRAVYYVSKAMTSPETRYAEIEKLALALIITARRLRPYFQAHPIIVLTKHPLSVTSRISNY
ncbi:hypothetical protein ACOSP7_015333 [Xanthoceras sorbifolium]